ncbi:MAG: NrdH-redoxin [Chloroflexi bacterium]|nr:NrdH-redoxin [Chloroflexota bacterium]
MDNNQPIVVYGTTWCGDCHRVRSYLNRRQIPYRWIDIGSDREAALFVMRTNRGMRSVPTIVFPDGTILVEPSTAELAQQLGR